MGHTANYLYIDGFMQDCSTYSANALELLQSSAKPSIFAENTERYVQTILVSDWCRQPTSHHLSQCWHIVKTTPFLATFERRLILHLNPWRAEFMNHERTFVLSIISRRWRGTGSPNPSSWKRRMWWPCVINAMVDNSLRTQMKRNK